MDLPLLGEPLPVELANTRYESPAFAHDYFARVEVALAWLQAVQGLHQPPEQLAAGDHAALVALRDAVCVLLDAAHRGVEPPTAAVCVVNDAARRASVVQVLDWSTGAPCASRVSSGAPVDRALRHLADATIALLCGPDRAELRRCAAPDCTMWFVRQHRRRAYCHVTCAQRHRQARHRSQP